MPAIVGPSEWPTEYIVWLGKAGITTDAAYGHGAGYAKDHNRFMLPCSVDGRPTGAFTGRSLDAKRPKYVGGGRGARVWIAGYGKRVVFVEDVLSAWRVHAAGYRACAVLGTAFPPYLLSVALQGCSEAVGWFDPDPAGQKAYRTLRKTLGLYDVTVRKVSSERDPKLHSKKEIQQLIGE